MFALTCYEYIKEYTDNTNTNTREAAARKKDPPPPEKARTRVLK